MTRSLNIKRALTAWLAATVAYDLLAFLAWRVCHDVYSVGIGKLLYRPFLLIPSAEGVFLALAYQSIITGTFVTGYLFWRNSISRKEWREGIGGGIIFALFIWLIGVAVTLLHVYLAMNIELSVIIYWITMDLINYLLMGVIAGAIYRDV